ncbi:M1 family metallopeptidase [Pendulispora albinea]|uniref:Peptidase M1 membrane alanine aminopeptidase domain-containing protein n=1 Tax=Pendulispora albinea TaxID=2741071 RepID=A0ABZ2LW66_9BACT
MKTKTMGAILPLLPLLLLAPGCSSDPDPTNDPGKSATELDRERNSVRELEFEENSKNRYKNRTFDGDVTHYDYAVDLASGAVHGTLDVRVEPPGGRCFAATASLPVTGAEWNGRPAASSTQSGDELLVCGPRRVLGGERIRVGAHAKVPEQTFLGLDVGFSRKKDLAGGTFTYLLSWVEGCSHFGACDPDPSRLAEFHFDVAHAPGEVVLCPGRLSAGTDRTRCDLSRGRGHDDADESADTDERARHHGTARAPTYSAVAVASDPLWKRAPFVRSAGVDLVAYEVPGGTIAASLDKAAVDHFFRWITDFLGPFPYGDELRFAGAPTYWSGFEHPANILLNEKLPSRTGPYANTLLHVLMHEITHQWAGDRSTLKDVGDFVWKESTAEYLSYVFEREHRPAGEADMTRAYWDRVSLQSTHYPRPTDRPLPAVQDFYRDVYGPGPMVLYVQLEDLIGKDAVLDAIRLFLARPAARSVHDLRRTLERVSGEDLADYFDAWVFGEGKPAWPAFSVSTAPKAGGDVVVEVTQTSADNELRGCVVEVEVESTNGAKVLAKVDFGLHPRSARARTTVSLGGGSVKSVTVDPRHRVINVDPAAASTFQAGAGAEEILLF